MIVGIQIILPGNGMKQKKSEAGGETPTVLLRYVNIYFRRRYLAGDGSMEVQRSPSFCAPGLVKFVPAVARLSCLALPESFLTMFAQNIGDLCTGVHWVL